MSDRRVDRAGRGALSGVLATGVMSLFMLAARQAHWLGTPPPKKLTDRLLRSAGRSRLPGSSWPVTALNHAAFGAVAGIPFALVSVRIGTTVRRTIAGSLYGAAIWAAMYEGVLPALGLMPRPRWDRPGRPTSMAIAHVLYGAALGALVDAHGPPNAAGRRSPS